MIIAFFLDISSIERKTLKKLEKKNKNKNKVYY